MTGVQVGLGDLQHSCPTSTSGILCSFAQSEGEAGPKTPVSPSPLRECSSARSSLLRAGPGLVPAHVCVLGYAGVQRRVRNKTRHPSPVCVLKPPVSDFHMAGPCNAHSSS